MSSKTNTVAKISNPEQLKALQAELAEKTKAVKQANELAEWEQKTAERNPAYVVGSVRKATEGDAAILGHVHGLVCEIRCQACGQTRVVNKQDAFQVKFCSECRKSASREVAKEKRLTKKMAGVSAEDIAKQIAELNALLAAKGEPKKAKRSRKAKVEAVAEPTTEPVAEAAPTTEPSSEPVAS
jgi:hypothetical protein